jgi:hypothetical protein
MYVPAGTEANTCTVRLFGKNYITLYEKRGFSDTVQGGLRTGFLCGGNAAPV